MSENKKWYWIAGGCGCLAILGIGVLLLGGLTYLGYRSTEAESSGASAPTAKADPATQKAGRDKARQVLGHFVSGDREAAWNATHQGFRKTTPKEEFGPYFDRWHRRIARKNVYYKEHQELSDRKRKAIQKTADLSDAEADALTAHTFEIRNGKERRYAKAVVTLVGPGENSEGFTVLGVNFSKGTIYDRDGWGEAPWTFKEVSQKKKGGWYTYKHDIESEAERSRKVVDECAEKGLAALTEGNEESFLAVAHERFRNPKVKKMRRGLLSLGKKFDADELSVESREFEVPSPWTIWSQNDVGYVVHTYDYEPSKGRFKVVIGHEYDYSGKEPKSQGCVVLGADLKRGDRVARLVVEEPVGPPN